MQRDVQSLSTTTTATATAAATAITAATVTTTAGVTTRDAAPRISRWGDRVAMTAGNPRGYERFYAPSLEPRPPSGPRARFALVHGDDGASRRFLGPPGLRTAATSHRPLLALSTLSRARRQRKGLESEGPKFPRLRRRAPETSRRKLRSRQHGGRSNSNIVILSWNKLARRNRVGRSAMLLGSEKITN